ncbi:hypothetical protein [Amycolatopsis sp. 195334CR]|uniref:hypothetical protein n=1 Tax=Amycolatopsis sp. 195334CR TaxID=2814588 RepID=UPI001A8D902F|nr:hypothetical protein [Amycolatopsis sp. 195334CR]MBN6035287.1 hypothetical protein [Amycolatopsis sp. 195334CR]
MNESEFFDQLRNLRTANGRAIHKPLLLLWLFARQVKNKTTQTTYAEAEEAVGQLIDEFSPASQRGQRDRAAMPFVHLERSLWSLQDGAGNPIPPTPSRTGSWLRDNSARGRLRPEVADHVERPQTLSTAIKLLFELYLDEHQADQIIKAAGLHRVYRQKSPVVALSTTTATKPIKSVIDTTDYDGRLRRHAFEWLAELNEEHGGRIPFGLLQEFRFEGKRIALMDQQAGIRKPKELSAALSLRTSYTPPSKQRPYEDELDENGLIRYYMYRGTDPQHFHNVAMRRAFTEKRPMIWFKGVASGLYEPHFPLLLTKDEPENLRFLISFA